jgi:DNA (cytosine-5)-methyltransferase 1
MKAISLFSGVEGFGLGFERAGIETVLQAEQDKWCLEVLARHWPEVERVTDVRDVRDGDADLIYGGFPCQDLSVAGKRAGLGGDRSGLWFEFHRVLSELLPRWAVIENVPGLLSSNQGRDFGILLNGLDELGFDVAWTILDAQHFGVPQRRRRLFIVAGPRGRGAEQVLALCESCGGNPAPRRTTGKDVASGSTASSGRNGENGAVAVRTAQTGSNGWGIGTDEQAYTIDGAQGQAVANPLGANKGGIRLDLDNDTYVPIVVGALSDGAHHGGGLNGQDAYTGRVLAPSSGVRRLTPRECERLMGWPDDHTRYTADGTEIAGSHRYRMAGNGVVAPVAEWLGHRLVAVDGWV